MIRVSKTLSQEFETYVTSHRANRPIMYTFYSPQEGAVTEDILGDESLLTVWKEKWYEAGWEPKILKLSDGMAHPRFHEFESKLQDVPLSGPNVVYNQLCFIRWIAMAAVGGGWMCDMDVLPLNFHNPNEYFQENGGRFAIYSSAGGGGIPCLMSGSESEWERLAFEIVENGIEQRDKELQFWSDMLASIDIYKKNSSSYELFDLMGDVTKVDWNDKESCHEYDQKLAVHFSHNSMHMLDKHKMNLRYQAAAQWMDEWKTKC